MRARDRGRSGELPHVLRIEVGKRSSFAATGNGGINLSTEQGKYLEAVRGVLIPVIFITIGHLIALLIHQLLLEILPRWRQGRSISAAPTIKEGKPCYFTLRAAGYRA